MKKEFLEMRVRFISTLIVMILLFFLVMALKNWGIEILRKNQAELSKFAGKGLLEKLKDWNFYIYSQWYGKNLGQFIPIIGIIFAFPLFSREIENGTIEYLLTRSNRPKVFTEKITVSLLLLSFSIVVLCLLPLVYTIVPSISFNARYVPTLTLHAVIGSIIWYSIAVFFSVIYSDQVKPLISSLAVLAITTVAGMVKHLRFFNTYGYIMNAKSLIFEDVLYSSVSVALIYASFLVFKRREF